MSKPKTIAKKSVSSLVVGVRVNLRAKFVETYEGILDSKDRTGLEVIDVCKGRVTCRTSSGEKVLLSRSHIEISHQVQD